MKSKMSFPLLFVSICCGIALLLRLYGLHAESAWWDEYASLAFLDAPSLAAFLQQNRTLDPATLPLYFVFEYLWAHWVSSSVYGLRLLSIGIGVAAIPLVYALGARIFGRRAGYLAAFLLALSPMHIHHSQGIRMYGLLVLLGVASVWSLVRMIQQGKRSGWWLHGLVSMLLYWTHPFALLIPAAQGCWLLLHRRLYRPLLPGWFMMHAMLALPAVTYILSIRFWPQETTGAWLNRPGLGTVIADLFFDDIVAFHWQLRLSDIGVKLGTLRMVGDFAFAVVILGCLAYWLYAGARQPQTSLKRHLSLLFFWLILPPLTLFLVSLLWRPCMFPRYTAHCAIALYILLGGTVQQLHHREWRWCAYAVLSFFMLFQWAITLPGPQRTDWQSAARLIHENAQPQDIVLVDNLLWRDVFLYNATHVAQVEMVAPVAAAATLPLLATQSILFLGSIRSTRQELAAGTVWAVIAADYFETAPPLAYEEQLTVWGITFERRKFHGIRDVYVYQLQAAPTLQLPYTLDDFYSRQQEDASVPFSGYLKHEDMQAFAELATAFAAQQRKEQALGLMTDLFLKSPFSEKVYGNLAQAIVEDRDTDAATKAIDAVWKGYGYRENERHELARQAFAEALALDPDNGVAALELGFELTALAQYKAAAAAFERAAVLDSEDAELVDNLVEAIRTGNQIEQSFRAVTLCREGLIALSNGNMDLAETLFQQALAEDSQLPRAQVMLGFIRALQERYDEAFDLFSAYLAHGKYHAPVAYSHLAIIHLLRDEPEQALQYATKAMALDPDFKRQTEPLINALLIDKDFEAAADQVKRMEEAGIHVPPLFKEYLQKRLQ
jgi:mannosyltransferase